MLKFIESVQANLQSISNKNRIMLLAGVIIIVVVVAAVIAVFSGIGGTNSAASQNVARAKTLQYSVIESGSSNSLSYSFYGENIGLNKFLMRIEYATSAGNIVYVFNGGQQKEWLMTANQWKDMSSSFNADANRWEYDSALIIAELGSWNGICSYSFITHGTTMTVSNIIINPNLSDSLFAPS
jgi:hypothetical protein